MNHVCSEHIMSRMNESCLKSTKGQHTAVGDAGIHLMQTIHVTHTFTHTLSLTHTHRNKYNAVCDAGARSNVPILLLPHNVSTASTPHFPLPPGLFLFLLGVRCGKQQHTTTRCNTLSRDTPRTVCCRMLQCAAVCCSVLQCVAVCCSEL